MKRGVPTTILKYVTAQFLKTLCMTLVICTALGMFALAVSSTSKQFIGPGQLLRMMPYLGLMALPYTLGMAVLFGASASYGRMSAENEIRAMEWNGMHVGWVMLPGIAIAVAATVVSLWIAADIEPLSRQRREMLLRSNVMEIINRKLLTATSTTSGGGKIDLPNLKMTVKEYDPKTLTMSGVTIFQTENANVLRTVEADYARIVHGKAPGAVLIRLDSDADEADLLYVTLIFMKGRLKEYDPEFNSITATGAAPPVSLGLSTKVSEEELSDDPKELSFFRLIEYAENVTDESDRWEARTLIYERLAMGLSPFFFAILAVPMSIAARWKHMLASLLPSLLIVILVWWPLFIVAKVLGESGRLNPTYWMFAANAVMVVIGAALVFKILRR